MIRPNDTHGHLAANYRERGGRPPRPKPAESNDWVELAVNMAREARETGQPITLTEAERKSLDNHRKYLALKSRTPDYYTRKTRKQRKQAKEQS